MIKNIQRARVSGENLIEEKARQLLHRYWKQKEARLGGDIDPKSLLPIDVKAIAREILGLEVAESWDVGSDTVTPSSRMNLVGGIHRYAKKIVLARGLSSEIERFTLAHEIGHFLLHPNVIQFREDPRTDIVIRAERKSPLEHQADRFAGFLAMPRKLVVYHYKRMFGDAIDGANLSEDQAYCILGENGIPSEIAKLSPLDLARIVAVATSLVYGQPRVLTEIFGVSPTAMGRQLLLSGLVKVSS